MNAFRAVMSRTDRIAIYYLYQNSEAVAINHVMLHHSVGRAICTECPTCAFSPQDYIRALFSRVPTSRIVMSRGGV